MKKLIIFVAVIAVAAFAFSRLSGKNDDEI